MRADPTRIALHTDPATRRMTGTSIHGLVPFDVPFISEIAPNLWQGGCTNGLVLPAHIKHLVSLYPWETYTWRHELGSALAVRMLDSTDQQMEQVPLLAAWVNACRKTGPVLVHCQAGLNRSSLVAATALMLEGLTADEAIALIRGKRSPACLCNPAFEAWLRDRPAVGPRIGEADCIRIYARRGRVAHLSQPAGGRGAMCGFAPEWPAEFFGTGSQREYDRAAAMPTCKACTAQFAAHLTPRERAS